MSKNTDWVSAVIIDDDDDDILEPIQNIEPIKKPRKLIKNVLNTSFTNEEHIIELEKVAQKHDHLLAQMAQEHQQEMDKLKSQLSVKTLEPAKKKK